MHAQILNQYNAGADEAALEKVSAKAPDIGDGDSLCYS
jgi:hypothetical protein